MLRFLIFLRKKAMKMKIRLYCICFTIPFSEKIIDISISVSHFYHHTEPSASLKRPKRSSQGLHITGLTNHILVGKNKELVFTLIFINVSEAYLTPDGKNTISK